MILVAAFISQMEDIGGICQTAIKPVGDIFSKATTDPGIIPDFISIGELSQSALGPIPHWYHYRFLIHMKFVTFIELQQPFSGNAEAVGPFTRITIFLMPDKFLSP